MSLPSRSSERYAVGRLLAVLVFGAEASVAAALCAGVVLMGAGHAQAAASVPGNQSPRRVNGITEAGLLLKASRVKWSGSPTSYRYRWTRCNSAGRECKGITAATTMTYLLARSDVG